MAVFLRNRLLTGIDIGQPWGEFGELRLGWSHLLLGTTPQLISVDFTGPDRRTRWIEEALRARAVVDQLDFASFPQSGYRAEAEAWVGRRSGDTTGSFSRVEAQATVVRSVGAHTLSLHGLLQVADQRRLLDIGRYSLGGFHQLSGYQIGQLTGNDVLFVRLNWYRRLNQSPTLTRGFFVGATLEAGNVWDRSGDVRLSDLRSGMSLFVGTDTGIGPLYLGLTHAPRGSTGLALFIGRP